MSEKVLSKANLRDYIIRVHGLSSDCHTHPPAEEMLRRINRILEIAIMEDAVMSSFLGYGDGKHDALSGDGSLDDDNDDCGE